jgi:hypothetical protein
MTVVVPIDVTGTSFRQPSLVDLSFHVEQLRGLAATLRPESTNVHDPNAIAVDVSGVHVAYLPRTWRKSFHEAMKAAVERLLEGEGKLLADLVQFRDEANQPRWTVRLYGEFGDA